MKKVYGIVLAVVLGISGSLSASLKNNGYIDSPFSQNKINLEKRASLSSSFNYSSYGMIMPLPLPTDENHGKWYNSYELLPFPVPSVGIGHREKYRNYAIDASIDLSSLLFVQEASGQIKYLHYFHDSNVYLGAGLYIGSYLYLIVPNTINAAPVFCLGKETEKRFYQLDVRCPTVISGFGIVFSPVITCRYGFKF